MRIITVTACALVLHTYIRSDTLQQKLALMRSTCTYTFGSHFFAKMRIILRTVKNFKKTYCAYIYMSNKTLLKTENK